MSAEPDGAAPSDRAASSVSHRSLPPAEMPRVRSAPSVVWHDGLTLPRDVVDCPDPFALFRAGEILQDSAELQIAIPRGKILMAFTRPCFSPAIFRFVFGRAQYGPGRCCRQPRVDVLDFAPAERQQTARLGSSVKSISSSRSDETVVRDRKGSPFGFGWGNGFPSRSTHPRQNNQRVRQSAGSPVGPKSEEENRGGGSAARRTRRGSLSRTWPLNPSCRGDRTPVRLQARFEESLPDVPRVPKTGIIGTTAIIRSWQRVGERIRHGTSTCGASK
ncbi:hypothetical protein SAMN05216228_1012186 [Rhizobium tibeticum]|uniref:Uncharacterized protein n=1 Tax=Rhizobium tibeticum TaxID=501024 RepID=A0A1H8MHM1_9HYPH|nr:hypothetical protein RTCCBAU85039_3059 [Rhizobium tibeticum]SEO16885.1 hypothetical protein SAMN05216228_1012186 [Rhizobium tibeticum]